MGYKFLSGVIAASTFKLAALCFMPLSRIHKVPFQIFCDWDGLQLNDMVGVVVMWEMGQVRMHGGSDVGSVFLVLTCHLNFVLRSPSCLVDAW